MATSTASTTPTALHSIAVFAHRAFVAPVAAAADWTVARAGDATFALVVSSAGTPDMWVEPRRVLCDLMCTCTCDYDAYWCQCECEHQHQRTSHDELRLTQDAAAVLALALAPTALHAPSPARAHAPTTEQAHEPTSKQAHESTDTPAHETDPELAPALDLPLAPAHTSALELTHVDVATIDYSRSLTPVCEPPAESFEPLSLPLLSAVAPAASSSASRPVHAVAAELEHAKAHAFDCGARGDGKTPHSASDDDDTDDCDSSEADSASEDESEFAAEQQQPQSVCERECPLKLKLETATTEDSELEFEFECDANTNDDVEDCDGERDIVVVIHNIVAVVRDIIAVVHNVDTDDNTYSGAHNDDNADDSDVNVNDIAAVVRDIVTIVRDIVDRDVCDDVHARLASLPPSIDTTAAPAQARARVHARDAHAVLPRTALASKTLQLPRMRARVTTHRRSAAAAAVAAPTALKPWLTTPSLAEHAREHNRRCRAATSKFLAYETSASYMEKRAASLARREQVRSASQRWH